MTSLYLSLLFTKVIAFYRNGRVCSPKRQDQIRDPEKHNDDNNTSNSLFVTGLSSENSCDNIYKSSSNSSLKRDTQSLSMGNFAALQRLSGNTMPATNLKTSSIKSSNRNDMSSKATPTYSSIHGKKNEKVAHEKSKIHQRGEEINGGMQVDELNLRKHPAAEWKETNDINKQPPGKVKTIIVYTKRKGQTDSPVTKSPKIQRPL